MGGNVPTLIAQPSIVVRLGLQVRSSRAAAALRTPRSRHKFVNLGSLRGAWQPALDGSKELCGAP